MKHNKISLVLIGFIAAAAMPAASYAGWRRPVRSVSVTTTQGIGNVTDARRSSDNVQLIYCHSGGDYGICVARSPAGDWASCYSYDAAHMQAMASASATSNIYFGRVSSTDGHCSFVDIHNGSIYMD